MRSHLLIFVFIFDTIIFMSHLIDHLNRWDKVADLLTGEKQEASVTISIRISDAPRD
jgi:hypothetical protein